MKFLGALLAILGVMVGVVSAAFGIMIVIALVSAIPVWIIWNMVMPDVFGLPEISLAQSLGLCLLSSILIKSTNVTKKG